MTHGDVSVISDKALVQCIKEQKALIENLKEQTTEAEKDMAAYQLESDRREIAKLPIKAGDTILVTEDMLPKYASYMHVPFEVKIDAIARFDGDEIKVWCGRGGATIEDALIMHQAYLEGIQ